MSKRKHKVPAFQHHRDKEDLDKLFPHLRLLQKLAVKHGIPDVFQDNGGKYLQLALVTGLTLLKTREGNDAVDQTGRQYEIKTLNVDRVTSFTTHHHLNPVIISKYRKVDWIFAVYSGVELEAVYYMPVELLEPFFSKWARKWKLEKKDINNPKIPLKFVIQHGLKVFPSDQQLDLPALP